MNAKEAARQAVIAAVCVVLGLALMPISFGVVQCRVSECLIPLAYYNKKHTAGLALGCFITNMFSPLGAADALFGTLATLLVCVAAVLVGYIDAGSYNNKAPHKNSAEKDAALDMSSKLSAAYLGLKRAGIRHYIPVILIPFSAAVINGLVIGAEFTVIMGLPFIPSAASIALGEFAAVFIGVLAFRVVTTNEKIRRLVYE